MPVLKLKTASRPDRHGWTPARRRAQSARMRANRLWLHSTGPKTPAGKAKSAQNARKHGAYDVVMKLARKGLRTQRQFMAMIKHQVQASRQTRIYGWAVPTYSNETACATGRRAVYELLAAMMCLEYGAQDGRYALPSRRISFIIKG